MFQTLPLRFCAPRFSWYSLSADTNYWKEANHITHITLITLPRIYCLYISSNIQLTNSMEYGPSWEANSYAASQEITCLQWNPKVHYLVHNSQSLFPILSKMQPVHTFPSCVPKIHININFQCTPKSSKWSLPFRFSNQNSVCISYVFNACYNAVSKIFVLKFLCDTHWSLVWWICFEKLQTSFYFSFM
jgi:hypothetical protein